MNGTSDIVNSIGLLQRSSNHLSTLSSVLFYLQSKIHTNWFFSLCIYIVSDTRISTLKRNIMSMVKYSFTRQTTNLARVARMVIGPCSEVLRAVLMKKISPPDLKKFFANIPEKKKVRFKPFLRAIDSEDYSNFDIILLYMLLRHLALLPPPGNGWGKEPDPSDRSVSANTERIRLIRNKYVAHCFDASSTFDFKKISKSIIQIIQELETHLGLCTDKQDDVLKLISCMMDSEIEQIYIEKIPSESETYPGSKSILYNM